MSNDPHVPHGSHVPQDPAAAHDDGHGPHDGHGTPAHGTPAPHGLPDAYGQPGAPGQGPGHQPYATPEGWGGEYDADATAFVQLPGGLTGSGPGAPYAGESPLAAPGTGQGGYTPPPIQPGGTGVPDGSGAPAAPGMGTPMTPAASTDPAAPPSTGQWTLPFAAPSADPGGFGGVVVPDQAAEPDPSAGAAPGGAAAMGQGAAAALAGSHEARVRRPLGTGVGTPADPDAPADAYGPHGPAQAPQQAPGQGSLADALARRQVPFPGAEQGVQPEIGTAWPDPAAGPSGPHPQQPHDPQHPQDAHSPHSANGPHSPHGPQDPQPGQLSGPPPGGAAPQAPAGASWGALPQEVPVPHPGAVPPHGTPPGLPEDGPVGYAHTAPAPAPATDGPPPQDAAAAAAPESPDRAAPLPDAAGPLPPHDWEAAAAPGARWDSTVGGHTRPDDSGEYDMSAPPPSAADQAVDQAADPAADALAYGEPAVHDQSDTEPQGQPHDPHHPHDANDPERDAVGAAAPDGPDRLDPAEAPAPAAPAVPTASEHPHSSYLLHVNGADRPVTDAWIGESLLYVLRERLGLAGAKDGCSQGECGACSVQVDGRLVASCLVPAATAAGSDVRTVEGLAADGTPSDVQRALTECGAVQCGFCVPGMAMAVHDLLAGNHAPTELQTRQAICGNLCRCSGYRGVLDAVRTVAQERAAKAAAEQSDGADQATGGGAPNGAAAQNGHAGQQAQQGQQAQPGQPRIPQQASPGTGGVRPAEGGGA